MNFGEILLLIGVWAYTVFSIFIVTKELISDFKNPYLGVSSSYIFIYFIACLLNLLQLCVGNRHHFTEINYTQIILFFLGNIIALYHCVIFLVKKFTFQSIKAESAITLGLLAALFFEISILIVMRESLYANDVFHTTSVIEYYYFLICGLSTNAWINKLITIFRAIPLSILFVLWFYSVTKAYNKKSLNFYPKSANKPIILFLAYQFLLLLAPNLILASDFDKVLLFVTAYGFKLYFCISVLHWLRHKDMEQVETSMIARSKKKEA